MRLGDPAERLIVALDVPDAGTALRLVDEIGPACRFYKIGLELAMSGDYFTLLSELKARDKRIFCDLKFHDIPNTVAAAVRRLDQWEPDFVTVHAEPRMLEAAAEAAKHVKVLAVTVLTSLDQDDLNQAGYALSLGELARQRAERARQAGCAGLICSGHEASALRGVVGRDLALVCPGIRPQAANDDQKRTMTPREAMAAGADYLVLGRAVLGASDPARAAAGIQDQIQGALAEV